MMDTTQDMGDVFAAFIRANRRAVRTAVVGKVESYDPATQSATVTPWVQESRVVDGEETAEDAVELEGVPVVWPGGASRGLTLGLEPGDLVLLVFRHRSHDEIDDGKTGPLLPKLKHRSALADVVAFAGYLAPGGSNAAGRYDADGAVVLYFPGAEALLVGDSTANKALALAEKVDARLEDLRTSTNDLRAAMSTIGGHTHNFTWTAGGGSGVTLGPSTAFGPVLAFAATDCDDVKVRS